MNDPLKDTRVFPEQMHEKPQPQEDHPHYQRKLLWAAVVAFVVVAIYLLVATDVFKKTSAPAETTTPDEVRYSQEQEAAEAIDRYREELSPEEKERRLNMLFSNN